MDSPFLFVKEVVGDLFVGRKDELTWLASNMQNAQNTVIIASPRSGKTSLIRQAAIQVQKQDLNMKFCYLNMFNVRDPHEYCTKLTNSIMQSIANTTDDWQKLAAQYLPSCAPEIVVDPKQNEVYLRFDTNTFSEQQQETAVKKKNKYISEKYADDEFEQEAETEQKAAPALLGDAKTRRAEVISFGQQYAMDKNIKLVICIEEIQNVENFDNSTEFQKEIAKAMKLHTDIAYIVTGDKKNALRELFETPRTPFYKFGEIFTLPEIDQKTFADFITKAFSKSGRVIQKELAERLCTTVQNHPYYVQLYSHLVWHNTRGFATELIVDSTIEDLLDYCHYAFNRIVEGLSNSQINYLKAVIDGVDRFCSSENIMLYKLNSSANITRVRGALEKKEILEFVRNRPYFIDPVFELWFRQRYMKNRPPLTVN